VGLEVVDGALDGVGDLSDLTAVAHVAAHVELEQAGARVGGCRREQQAHGAGKRDQSQPASPVPPPDGNHTRTL
jgi:hypothetical protein